MTGRDRISSDAIVHRYQSFPFCTVTRARPTFSGESLAQVCTMASQHIKDSRKALLQMPGSGYGYIEGQTTRGLK